jgi:hypothetical protein
LLDSRLQGYELQPFFRITHCTLPCPDSDPPAAPAASCSHILCLPRVDRVLRYATSRATSSALRPTSSCFSAPIICASVCLLFDIPSSPFFPQIILSFVRKQGSVTSPL